MNETGDYQDVGTFAQLNANGNGCVANTTFKLPANNLFSVQVSSDLETPEPGVAGLVGLGLAGIALLRKRST